MSEPTVPNPSVSEGWPPAVPSNPNPTPTYYPAESTAPSNPVSNYERFYVEKPAEILEGEKLAKTSTILGIVSIYFVGLILGPMAIIKAAKAEKLGVDSTVGKVTGWLGTIIAGLTVIGFLLYALVLGAIFSGMDKNPDGLKTGGFSNSQESKPSDQNGPAAGLGGTAYDKLTPAEKAEVNQYLEEVVKNR